MVLGTWLIAVHAQQLPAKVHSLWLRRIMDECSLGMFFRPGRGRAAGRPWPVAKANVFYSMNESQPCMARLITQRPET